jgi:hypothetical protein
MTTGFPASHPARKIPAAKITVECARPGTALIPSVDGVFFEDINHASDGACTLNSISIVRLKTER